MTENSEKTYVKTSNAGLKISADEDLRSGATSSIRSGWNGSPVDISELGVTGEHIRTWLEKSVTPSDGGFYGGTFYPWRNHMWEAKGKTCSGRLLLPEKVSFTESTVTRFAGTFADTHDEEAALFFFTPEEGAFFSCACREVKFSSFVVETTLSEAIRSILKANGLFKEDEPKGVTEF